ncbi:MAG: hypothetical protein GC178_12615 [Flavobacteriales bacterium]|nr:hypothetical protein [Flavobacteriales bacterium]
MRGPDQIKISHRPIAKITTRVTLRNTRAGAVIFILSFLFTGCWSTKTDDPKEAWKYWLGIEVPQQVELYNGEYYQSPHFTLEYELFLKFKTDKSWFIELAAYNNLELDTTGNDWARWTELPAWFKPDKYSLTYCKDQTDVFERSRYIINPKTGVCYVYETVGM